MQSAICNLNLLKSIHFITDQLNQLSSQHFLSFCINLSKVICHIKKPARSTLVFFDWQDRHTPARLPWSNEATGRVTKGQVVQLACASLANEVVLILPICIKITISRYHINTCGNVSCGISSTSIAYMRVSFSC